MTPASSARWRGRILEGLDFKITEAEDGQQALEQCRAALPDAVLLDWNMPVMDGYDFLKALRRLPGGDGPKVVFCTTENDVAHIARALSAGANEYIMKPFDREIVEAKFQEVGLMIFRNSSAFNDAPPISPPSTSGMREDLLRVAGLHAAAVEHP